MAGFDEILTPTETLVLHRRASGRTHAQIGGQLGSSVKTLERHVAAACRKTGAQVWARDHGRAP